MKKVSKFLPFFLLSTAFLPFTVKYREVEKINAVAATEGRAECVMEVNSRRVLYEHNGDIRLPMASTTKIATAITAIEECENLAREIRMPKEAVGVEGSSIYAQEGEVYTLKDLLYGLMLRSGNDAATAIALSVGGSVENFAAMMNQTAQKAGALATNFVNPHGLPDREHYTTARDLSYIACFAMQNEKFREIVATKYYEPRAWKNKNKLLERYEGGCGVKTGYTKEAGRCLVSAASREKMTLVCTILNCSQTYERTEELFDDSFAAYEYTRLLSADEQIEINVNGKRVKGVAKDEFYYPLLQEEKELIKIKRKAVRGAANKQKDEIIGQFQIYLSKQLLFSGNLYKL